ncbi:MAG: nuclear transport factor 2 family protein [Actinomycetia bacterium]|jgi:hypothetical protein|nr:nuclear transport factor 2 family protein [Actinomycetes bacterium]MCH9830279.1 nuclear transport factor 2 family protein [Actinomycetes bacterium]MCH9840564.1 nuclear transport factor 2 family protein [Actinomycetes bacterium]
MTLSNIENASRLFSLYCWYYDSNDIEGIGSIFAQEIQVDYGPEFPTVTSRDELLEKVADANATRFLTTSHHVSNVIVVQESETSLTAKCYLYAWHQYRDGSPDGELWGRYHAEFIQENSQWKFQALRLRAAGTVDFHRSKMYPIERIP